MSDNFGNADSADTRALFGRREMLQRTGFVVGAAALWATPVVQTIGMRPAAATDDVSLLECEGQIARVVFRYQPNDDRGSQATWGNNEPRFEATTGGIEGCTTGATIKAAGGGSGQVPTLPMTVVANGVLPGDTFTVTDLADNGKLGAETRFVIEACGVEQDFQIHTSCSKDFKLNFRWYSLTVVGIFND